LANSKAKFTAREPICNYLSEQMIIVVIKKIIIRTSDTSVNSSNKNVRNAAGIVEKELPLKKEIHDLSHLSNIVIISLFNHTVIMRWLQNQCISRHLLPAMHAQEIKKGYLC
jgi:hypothetical protein